MAESTGRRSSPIRDPAPDWLRGVLVLFVLSLHAGMTSGVGRTSVPGYLDMAVGPILMPAFFVLSGILGRSALRRGWIELITGTLLRLLWPYFVWGLVYVLAVTLVEQKFDLNWQAFTLLLTRPAMLGPVWYLAYLAAFFVFARCLRLVPAWATTLVLAAITMVFSFMQFPLADALLHASAFFAGLSVSSRGAVVGWLTDTGVGRTVLPLTICVLGTTPYFVGDNLRDNGLFVWWILLASIVVVAGAQPLYSWCGSRFTMKIGTESLVFYLTHWPIMLVVRRANSDLHLVDPVVAFWLALALSLAVGALTVIVMRRVPFVRALFEPPRLLPAGLQRGNWVAPTPADLPRQAG